MSNNIKVSVVTPSYNQGAFIERTIQSVLNQSYSNIEYIVIDGGSTDNTLEILEKYKDRIDVVISEKDNGQADAINKGFRLATGKLVGWLNSDDVFYSDCVEKIVELYNNHPDEGAIYYHSINDKIDERDQLIETYQHIIPDAAHLIRENYSVIQQGSFYDAEILKKINYLDPTNYYCMDLDLWLNLLKHGAIYCTKDKSHSAFRLYAGTKTDTGQEKFLDNIHRVLKKHGAKSYHKTIWHTIYIYRLKVKIKKRLKL